MSNTENVVKLEIVDGCIEHTNWESHKRGKNWVATVRRNKASRFGMDREFWQRGSGRWYQVPELQPGDVVEMAGDYFKCSGRRAPSREYLRVTEIYDDSIVAEPCDSPR